jgi:16S rRNA G966 N2-methylase RsmD
MRIIAGAFKRRVLAGPRWPGLRPTSDRLRETLFDILGESVRGARVLDAFAAIRARRRSSRRTSGAAASRRAML